MDTSDSSFSIKNAINYAKQHFVSMSESARLDAECLLSFVLQKNDVYLRTWPDVLLTSEQHKKFLELVTRREQGEPIAYILGTKQFWSLDLSVSKDTLIPRPETEMLVEEVVKIAQQQKVNAILELGTGSGAIAIAVSSELQKLKLPAKIIAGDISIDALKIAKKNTARYKQPIEIIHSDWFESVETQKFDIIVSNPPYIENNDAHLSEGDVRFEPISALASGDDGLDAIRYIIKEARKWLSPSGYLLFEHGYHQASAVRELFKKNGYRDVTTLVDLSNNDRISFALYN